MIKLYKLEEEIPKNISKDPKVGISKTFLIFNFSS